MFLRQSTAVSIPVGPFLDPVDGSPETGLTLTQPDIRLKKGGGDWGQKSAAQTLPHEENGHYELELSTADTDTAGLLQIAVMEAGALIFSRTYFVVAATWFDGMTGADVLPVNTTEVLGTAVSADAGLLNTNVTHADGIAWSEGGVTALALDSTTTDAITASVWDVLIAEHLTADTTGAKLNAVSAPSAADVATAVWDRDATGHQTQGTFGQAIGDPGATAVSIWGRCNSNLDVAVGTRATAASILSGAGAAPTGPAGDTAGIQAKIDYLYAHVKHPHTLTRATGIFSLKDAGGASQIAQYTCTETGGVFQKGALV